MQNWSKNRGYAAKIAEFVAEGAVRLDGIEIRLLAVGEAPNDDLRWMDGLELGSPTKLRGISWRMKKWWDDLGFDIWQEIDLKIGCAFSSSGSWGGAMNMSARRSAP
jgi:NAD(P)H dehydrogenase (quinone)